MTDLITFLNARLDEDEAFAIAAAGADGKYAGRPHWTALGRGIVTDAGDPDWAVVDLSPCIEDAELGAHIARHDPARTLREVAAGRAILAEHQHRSESAAGGFGCSTCHFDQEYGFPGGINWCRTVRSVASVYSDHPDYREEWAS